MTFIILLISIALFLVEWFVIRKTKMNKYIPITIALAFSVAIGTTIGIHLVAFPLFFIILAWGLCEVEDRYFKRKGMTNIERIKLKNL